MWHTIDRENRAIHVSGNMGGRHRELQGSGEGKNKEESHPSESNQVFLKVSCLFREERIKSSTLQKSSTLPNQRETTEGLVSFHFKIIHDLAAFKRWQMINVYILFEIQE